MTSCSEGKNAHLKDEQEMIADIFRFSVLVAGSFCAAIGSLDQEKPIEKIPQRPLAIKSDAKNVLEEF